MTPHELKPLTEADFDRLTGIDREIVISAKLSRVNSLDGSQIVGRNGRGDYSGILIPYYWPGEDHVREYRLRRDHPEMEADENGRLKPKDKYLSPSGRGNLLYFPPGINPAWLKDPKVPIAITEGEKKTLALHALALHELSDTAEHLRWVSIGLAGVWNWKGTIGKTNDAQGTRVDVKGVIPDFARIEWKGRPVRIIFDANAHSNEKVSWARKSLASELRKRGAIVSIVDLPQLPGINGVDDLVGEWGKQKTLDLINSGKPSEASISVARDRWESRLLTNKKGEPKACLANAITALTYAPEWAGVLAYNEFALTTVTFKPTPWNPTQKSAEWKGADDIRLNDWLQHQGIMVQLQVTGQAVQAVAERQKFHPVRQFLNSLQWDGEKRLDDWLIRYLGVEATPYSRAVGAKWCISAVARIYKPGEKVDHCLILQGKQGKLKSTALRVLAVQPEWFTDELAEMGSKDSAMQVAGVWIIELSELDSFGRAEMGRIKAFMSRQVDRFRPPYGARLTTAPRNCAFAGTVNEPTFLKDATGARRFWTLKTGIIDIAGLKENREQLWAEAVHRYRSGENWWLDTDDLNEQARKAQFEHYAEGVWDERIAEWLLRPVKIGGFPLLHPYEEGSVSTEEILEHCIGKAPEKWTHSDQIAVSRAMTSKGWERFRSTFESESVNRPRRWRKCRE
jgi:predicted P-loop ATPase